MTIKTPKPKFRKPKPATKEQLIKEIASLKAGTIDRASKIYEYMQLYDALLVRVEQYQAIITARDESLATLRKHNEDLYNDLMRVTGHRDEAENGREFLLRVVKRLAAESAVQHARAERYLSLLTRSVQQAEFWRGRAERPIWRQMYVRFTERWG